MEPLSLPLIDKILFRAKLQYYYKPLGYRIRWHISVTLITILAACILFQVNSLIVFVIGFVAFIQFFNSAISSFRNNINNIPLRAYGTSTIMINSSGFRVNDMEPIDIDQVKAITLYSAMYEGYTNRELNYKYRQYYSGETVIAFQLADGSTKKYCLLIRSVQEMNAFIGYLKQWYKMGTNIKEYSAPHDDAAVLFRSDWTYEQYQELKKELGVERFY